MSNPERYLPPTDPSEAMQDIQAGYGERPQHVDSPNEAPGANKGLSVFEQLSQDIHAGYGDSRYDLRETQWGLTRPNQFPGDMQDQMAARRQQGQR